MASVARALAAVAQLFLTLISALWLLLQSITGLAIGIVMIPVATPLLLLLWLYRSLVIGVLRLIAWKCDEPLPYLAKGMDALFNLDSPVARPFITTVMILKGRPEMSKIRSTLADKVLNVLDARGRFKYPKFRQFISRQGGYSIWRDEINFSAKRHIKLMQENGTAVFVRDEDDLLDAVSLRANRPFVRGMSQWEVVVAPIQRFVRPLSSSPETTEGQDQKSPTSDNDLEFSYYAVIFRIHHAMGDGKSLVRLLLTSMVDNPMELPQSPQGAALCWWRIMRGLRFVWSMTHLPWALIRNLNHHDQSSLHGFRLTGQKVIAWSSAVSLDVVKRIKNQALGTVNDVIVTGLAAALNNHWENEGEKPALWTTAVIPVDVTNPLDYTTLANHISLCTTEIPTGGCPPISRYQSVRERLEYLKSSPDVVVNYFSLNMMSNLIPAPFARRLFNTHGVTMVVSNMPGPTETVSLFGDPVEDIMFSIPNKSRTGVGVAVLSYRGLLRFSITVDAVLISNRVAAKRLLDDVVVELFKLRDSLNRTDPDYLAGINRKSSIGSLRLTMDRRDSNARRDSIEKKRVSFVKTGHEEGQIIEQLLPASSAENIENDDIRNANVEILKSPRRSLTSLENSKNLRCLLSDRKYKSLPGSRNVKLDGLQTLTYSYPNIHNRLRQSKSIESSSYVSCCSSNYLDTLGEDSFPSGKGLSFKPIDADDTHSQNSGEVADLNT
ncbi:uncharacterized protein LOC143018508 [Oratosquilla oratoria]|uniref:uncharacterized protein LOC143018508 n=1 Tax=Oratosquilla oratoria TaxID=337810 RepID=UPI003F766E23